MKHAHALLLTLAVSAALAGAAGAHVPYIENRDYTFEQPFRVRGSAENSIAVYAWLSSGNDTDVYRLEIRGPVRLYCKALVPVCPGYEQFLPWMAVAGPGLPPPEEPLPFDLPEGCGAVVVKNLDPGTGREQFYEPFGGKSYYDAPAFDRTVSAPGTWYVYAWDPAEAGGDYVAVIGYKERFFPLDIIRALINTPRIRFNRELHTDCPD